MSMKSKKAKLVPGFVAIFKRNLPFIILVTIGFIGGFIWTVSLRYFLVVPTETHFHANFAVYIDGKREEFKDFTYYEEVAACTSAYGDNPKGRVHMHDKVNDVIHVHDKRVTYGDFFANIGWVVGQNVVETRDRVIVHNPESSKVVYVLNGEKVSSITSKIIQSEDRLLIAAGAVPSDVMPWYNTLATSAAEFNSRPDPTTCGGLNGASTKSILSRLKHASFWQ